MAKRSWDVRELVATGLAWMAGLALLHRCERLPNGVETAALAGACVLLFVLRRRHWLALAGCVAVLAFTQAALRAEWQLTPELHPAWEGRDLVLTGQVDSLPIAITGQGGVPGWRFEFAVEEVGPTGAALPPEVTHGLMAWLKLLTALPGAVWWLPAAPPWAQGLALLGAALMVMRLPWRLRLAGLAMTLPLLWPAVPGPAAGEFELLAPDIGQGNAVLVRTRGQALLFDSGPAYSLGQDAGERVLVPLLRSLGVGRLDMLMLSHRDFDHVGGAATLLQALPVGELRSSLEPGHALLRAAPAQVRCEAGQGWSWDGVRFDVLHPTAAHYDAGLKPNDLSCVLRITSASGRRALLAGDLEADQERRLVQREPDLRSTVLPVPHHGSMTSSSAELLAAVQPAVGLVQAGYRSRFGHPAPLVMARYQAAGIAVVASPSCGAWRWFSDGRPATCERELSRRYWSDRVAPPIAPDVVTGPDLPLEDGW